MIQMLVSMRWTVLVGALIGVLIAPAGQSGWRAISGLYDETWPVVVMQGHLVGRVEDAVVVEVAGEKRRDCRYLRIQAFARGVDGALRDVFAMRQDRPEAGATKPLGTFNIGRWKIWPTDDAVAVLMYSQHDCSGRIVQTKIADVLL